MKRLKLYILVFCLALSIPLAYLILQTYKGMVIEEIDQLRYFADTLFNQIEDELAVIIIEEENRAVDEYNYTISTPGSSTDMQPSPLSYAPKKPFILGYLQNNPDGSFQTPLLDKHQSLDAKQTLLLSQLRETNRIFNHKRFTGTDRITPTPAPLIAQTKAQKESRFSNRYLKTKRSSPPKSYLGRKAQRVETITEQQALNLGQAEPSVEGKKRRTAAAGKLQSALAPMSAADVLEEEAPSEAFASGPRKRLQKQFKDEDALTYNEDKGSNTNRLSIEVAPLQSVYIADERVYIFRRIMINHQIYRQGFILNVQAFLAYLMERYFENQPMADFARFELNAYNQQKSFAAIDAGANSDLPRFVHTRTFPKPFAFLNARISSDSIPAVPGRSTLMIMLGVLGSIIVLGMVSIYHSVRAVVDLSERRSRFVSSVTHELKTPLTNIRMYVEMLEQGVARNHEREQEYFQVLGSESTRLSHLIHNVLELSKLEKRQRHLNLCIGDLSDVVLEVQSSMQAHLQQEGFTLQVNRQIYQPFKYDREAMIQILINLIENSIKFGRKATQKQIALTIKQAAEKVILQLSDTGPGIPRTELKKIFDDFYRVDSPLTRATGGTGIGLALVKKLVVAMGGRVKAANNADAGCTITITLPFAITIKKGPPAGPL